jgi:hypothetical protein
MPGEPPRPAQSREEGLTGSPRGRLDLRRLVDPLAVVTASHLDQPFLVLGGELAEPTQNVLAVDWAGAGFRGEDLGQAAHHDPASFTPERCRDAVAAGVAALLSGQNGVVVGS